MIGYLSKLFLALNALVIWLQFNMIKADEVRKDKEEFCQSEYFQPRCSKNEVVLLKSATYGRMRIGRCVKAEEIAAFGSHFAEDPRYLGCSADVLSILDRKCSGRAECDFRVIDISDENIHPCFPGLNVYLEATYSCISVVDEKRSCAVVAVKTPTHIIVGKLQGGHRICGTKSSPWTVESPIGQRVKITLIDFTLSNAGQSLEGSKQLCHSSRGVIADKAGKRNISICSGNDGNREVEIYLSIRNAVEITFNVSRHEMSAKDDMLFMLKLEAVGCSDIVPAEDSWLRRNDDSITIGCYSSRQTWHLSCKDGKWIGVLGNCSQEISAQATVVKSEPKFSLSNDEEVLAIVAIGGCTLAICLTIVCVGAICLRRFYAHFKKKQEYKTLNYNVGTDDSQQLRNGISSDVAPEFHANDFRGFVHQQIPTYSVYVGESNHNGAEFPVSCDNSNALAQM